MKINDLQESDVAFVVDASWHLCPVPILMTEEKMNDMKAGQILKLLYTDPGVRPDLVAWCKATKNTLVGFKENKNINSAFIKKAN